MEKDLYFELLEFLEPLDSVPKRLNVYPFIKEHYKKPESLLKGTNNRDNPAKALLTRLSEDEFIIVDEIALEHICNNEWTNPVGSEQYQYWFDRLPISANITPIGQKYLKAERVKNVLTETSRSTKKTNDALQRSIRYQIGFGIIASIAIAITAIIAVMAYNKPDAESLILIHKSMQRQEQLLDSIRLLQKERNTYLKTMAKKTSPKKN